MSQSEYERYICCLYRVTSKLLQYPYDDVYEYIVKKSLEDLKPLLKLPHVNPSTAKSVEDYAKELESVKGNSDAKKELEIEYVRLFDLSRKCSPYESVHYTGRLMSTPAIDILRRCKQHGLEPSLELPDHVATELEYMYYLAYNAWNLLKEGEHESYEKILEEEKDFLKAHLSKAWIIRFFKEIEGSTHINFYKLVAKLMMAFIEAHAKYLGVWLENGE